MGGWGLGFGLGWAGRGPAEAWEVRGWGVAGIGGEVATGDGGGLGEVFGELGDDGGDGGFPAGAFEVWADAGEHGVEDGRRQPWFEGVADDDGEFAAVGVEDEEEPAVVRDGWAGEVESGAVEEPHAEGAGVHLRGQTAGVDDCGEAREAGFPCGEGGVDGGAGAGVDAGGSVVDAVEEDLVRAEGAVEFSEG
ncbi:MAG: hypothetical protein DVB22_000618 [Verrucomicrobia bacterium]|nr:MAG: hypothetical protein DVB22_000618 [Verrucomicrobiota bacterium]